MTAKQKRKRDKKEFRKYIKIADDRVLNTEKAHIELLAADEIFVQVNYADCYWISNYGRMANNNRLDKSFRMHKTKESGENPVHWTVVSYDIDGTPCHVQTTPGVLVAEHFLLKNTGCNKLWHIDENIHNNYYKNLIYVSEKEYEFLRKHVITVEQLGREQEYRDYNTVKGNPAYGIWYFMYARCYPEKSSLIPNACYDEASMCDLWLNDKDAFAEWYSMNYYECGGEKMTIDKDLLCRGNKVYAPDKCCLLPQTLNGALASATKPRIKGGKPYAIGVEFSSYRNKYYAKIQPFGEEKAVLLHYWDTEKEAFQEYKLFKESEIRILALRYRDKLPDHIFDALIKYEVRPYSPYEK